MLNRENKKIIISADDFGISKQANENILKINAENKLDRVEVMVSENIKKEEIQKLLHSGVKIDIHVHLAKDRLDYWQTNKRSVEKGAVKRILVFLFAYFFGDHRPKMAALEWENQIKKFIKMFGKIPDGISSHEHIHFFPPYFKVITRLSKKFNIPYIRFGKFPAKSHNKICLIMNFLRKFNKKRFIKSGLKTSDFMISFDWIDDFDSFLIQIPKGATVEVVYHPELENEYNFLEKI
jgi:chitin disaccharide deacetylase